MTKRDIAIRQAELAGFHGDTRRWTRLVVESRVNRGTLNEAWLRGVSMKAVGVKCSCRECCAATGHHD
jgi:hypothetical protein